MNMEDKITTTKNLNIIDVRSIFSQVLNMDSIQEAPGAHGKMLFERGYKMFGNRATSVMFKEYKHMEDMKLMRGTDTDSLIAEQKRKELRAVNIIKLKRRGKSKGRMFANGEPHCKFIPRKEAKSPTINMEIILATTVIDAYEDRKVNNFDVPGAYLQTNLPKEIFMILLLEGKFVDIIFDINPEYKQHIRFKYGKKALYLCIIKAIYRMIKSALMWY